MTTFSSGDSVLVRDNVPSVSPAVSGQVGTVINVTRHAVQVRFGGLRGAEGAPPTFRFLPDELKRAEPEGRETPPPQHGEHPQ